MKINYNEKNFAEEHSIDLNKYSIKNISFRPNIATSIILSIIFISVVLIALIFYIIDDVYSSYGYISLIIITSITLLTIIYALLALRVKVIYNDNLIRYKGIFLKKETIITSVKYYYTRTIWKNGSMDVYIFYDNKYLHYSTFETNKSNFILLLNLTKSGIPQLKKDSFYCIIKSLRKKN